jgi:multicomponent Na+:H+ antiporter subunit E
MSGGFVVAMVFWLLLTGDASPDNLIIGLVGSALAARLPVHRVSVFQMAGTVLRVLATLPAAFAQAFWLVARPHRHDRVDQLPPLENPDSWRTFERVFLVTLTPRTLAYGEDDETGQVDVHHIQPKAKP